MSRTLHCCWLRNLDTRGSLKLCYSRMPRQAQVKRKLQVVSIPVCMKCIKILMMADRKRMGTHSSRITNNGIGMRLLDIGQSNVSTISSEPWCLQVNAMGQSFSQSHYNTTSQLLPIMNNYTAKNMKARGGPELHQSPRVKSNNMRSI